MKYGYLRQLLVARVVANHARPICYIVTNAPIFNGRLGSSRVMQSGQLNSHIMPASTRELA